MKNLLLCGVLALGAAGCAHNTAVFTYETAYLRPLASPGGKFGALPQPVQNTVRAEAGGAEIDDVVVIDRLGAVSYEIYFRKDKILPPLLVAANGSVLNPDFSVAISAPAEAALSASSPTVTRIPFAEMSVEAARIVEERKLSANIDYIERATWGDRTLYVISFKDPIEHPKLYITYDGTVLKDVPKAPPAESKSL